MRHILLTVLMLLLCTPAKAEQSVVVGMGNFEPYFMENTQSGVFAELVTAIFNRMPGFRPDYRFGLSNHQLWGAYAGGRVDAVANVFDYVTLEGCRSDPVFRFRDVAITLQSEALQIESVVDLKNHSIVTFEGAYEFFGESFASVVNKQHYKEVGKPNLQARMLMAGRFDVSVGDLLIFLHARQELRARDPDTPLPAVTVHDIFPQITTRMAFKDTAICQAFNVALAELKASGEYDAIYERYTQRYMGK